MRTLVCLGVALAFVMPALADDVKAKHMRGKIVTVNAEGNTITIKEGDKETELKVSDATKFWGNDKKPLTGGLKADAFREGTEVWYLVGKDDQATMITELRFFNPGLGLDKEKDKDKDK